MYTPFSSREIEPIIEAYRRMLCEDAGVRRQNGIVAYSGDGSDMAGRFGPRSDTHGTGKCLALSYLNKVPDGFILIAEIQSVFKGYGKVLIENILSLCDNAWLLCDPTAKKSLAKYYRQFGLRETVRKRTKWHDGETHFFWQAKDAESKGELMDYFDEVCR